MLVQRPKTKIQRQHRQSMPHKTGHHMATLLRVPTLSVRYKGSHLGTSLQILIRQNSMVVEATSTANQVLRPKLASLLIPQAQTDRHRTHLRHLTLDLLITYNHRIEITALPHRIWHLSRPLLRQQLTVEPCQQMAEP